MWTSAIAAARGQDRLGICETHETQRGTSPFSTLSQNVGLSSYCWIVSDLRPDPYSRFGVLCEEGPSVRTTITKAEEETDPDFLATSGAIADLRTEQTRAPETIDEDEMFSTLAGLG